MWLCVAGWSCSAGAGGDLLSYEVHIITDWTDDSHRGTELVSIQCEGCLDVAWMQCHHLLQLPSERSPVPLEMHIQVAIQSEIFCSEILGLLLYSHLSRICVIAKCEHDCMILYLVPFVGAVILWITVIVFSKLWTIVFTGRLCCICLVVFSCSEFMCCNCFIYPAFCFAVLLPVVTAIDGMFSGSSS